MIEGLPLILLIGFLVVFFLYGNRLEGSGAGHDWSIAWVLLYVSSLVTEGPGASLEVPKALGHTAGTLCFAFLLRGACSFNDLKMPTWLLPAAFVVGLGRSGLELMGATSALWISGLAAEIPLITMAAYLIWVKGRHTNVEKALALSLGLIGLCSAFHSITSLLGDASDLVLGGYLGAAVLGAMMQLAAVLERVRTRQQVLISEHASQTRELDALVEAVPAGILMLGKQNEVRRMNRNLAELIAVDDRASFVGKRGREAILPNLSRLDEASQQRLLERFASVDSGEDPDVSELEIRLIEPEERILGVSASRVFADDGERLGRVWVARDVTEERQLSQRLYHAQRMETLGTLTGGVAHDFNNQLTSILGNANLVSQKLPVDHEMQEPLDDVVRSAERCAELTRGLMTFSRQTLPVMRALDAETVLAEVESVIRSSLPPDVRLDVKVASGLPPLEADPSQLHRVLTNLAVNARDAVGDEGTICLEARPADNAPGEAQSIEIIVSDSGPGMDAQVRERIFDPFYTTKPVGEGTGLGLAIVYGIVESHGASVDVESEPGQGARFRLLWPAAGTKAALEEKEEAPAAVDDPAEGRTILLAEDEHAVRRLVRRSLEICGYRVIETCDGEEALAALRERGDEIAVALVDLSMPRRNGADTIAAMREIRPGLPAILMTGNPNRVQAPEVLADVPVVMKPFSIEELENALRDSLAEAE